ncbi:alanine racemase [bacterium]|nr:alanine racemase [bacterium]
MPFSRPIWVEISKGALAGNVTEIKNRAGNQDIIAVVKANAYGHGLVGTCKALREIGIREFAVASVGEGLELRHGGIGQRSSKILVLGYSLPTHAEEVVRSGLCQTVISSHEIRALAVASEKLGKPARIQIKIDTGMHRLGAPAGDFNRLMDALKHYPTVKLDGVYTHFSSADEPDNPITKIQFDTFKKALKPYKLDARVTLHASNSSALVNFPRFKLDKIRPGIALYGEYASPMVPRRLSLTPALSLKSRLVEVKTIGSDHGAGYNRRFVNETSDPCRLGIIPVGYADGFMTASSGRREVLIRGHRCRVVGAVSMDFVHVLLPDDLSIGVGEPVTLIGTDNGETITATELGEVLGTHAYEILCLIPTRIPRKYVD